MCTCATVIFLLTSWLLQADLNQAIAMVSYYASSSEPAQVRGKTVYLQYSNRQEIVTSKNSGDVASNVLLVTVEGVEAGDVSIDVLHLVSYLSRLQTLELDVISFVWQWRGVCDL